MPVSSLEITDPVHAGQALYTHRFLKFYDVLVYRFNCPLVWRCSKQRMVDLYDRNVSGRHLDFGVGTGLLMDECRFPVAQPELTLMDLNPNSLGAAAGRLQRYRPRTLRANVLEEWGVEPGAFDSVALTHILHCVPGSLAEKAVAFEHASAALAPGGVLFGATILGAGLELSPQARAMRNLGNLRGILHNREDSPADLDAALGRIFDTHRIAIVGAVALFTARNFQHP